MSAILKSFLVAALLAALPAIDRMAREGTIFTQFYPGAAVCAPTRSVLMTGLHTGHARVRDNFSQSHGGRVPLEPEARRRRRHRRGRRRWHRPWPGRSCRR